MGEFDLNLSTRPFRAYQLKTLVLAIALIVLVALSLWQAYGFARYSRMASQIRSEEQNAQVESEALGRSLAEMESKLTRPEAAAKLSQIEFFNGIIARKTLSWTRIFADLENLMPPNVHLIGLRPDFGSGGAVVLHVEVEARSVDDWKQFADALQASNVFNDVTVSTQENRQSGAAGGAPPPTGADEGIAFTVKYHPEREGQ